MTMSSTLKTKSGELIYQYSPEEKHWWVTGFNPHDKFLDINPDDLVANFTIKFNDKDMFEALRTSEDTYNWTFDANHLSAYYTF